MFKTRHLMLLLAFFGLLLLGCKENSKTEKNTNDTSSPKNEKGTDGSSSKTETKNDAYVIVHLDDGSSFEMKVKRQSGKAFSPNRLTANLTDYGSIVMLRLNSIKTPIEEKSYEKPDADMTLKNVTKDGPLDEEYRSYYHTNANGEEGKTKITITSIGDNHSKGTFKSTLYSKSHKKAIVEGKFSTNWKKK